MKRSTIFSCLCLTLITVWMTGCGGSSDAPDASISDNTNTQSKGDGEANTTKKVTKPAEIKKGPTAEELAAAKSKLVGTWKGEVEINSKGYDEVIAMLIQDEDETAKPQFEALVNNIKTTKMTLELKEDDSMNMTVSVTIQGEEVTQPSGGKWEVADVKDDQMIVKFTREEDNHVEAQRFSFETDDAFSTNGPGGEALEDVAILKFNRLR